MDPAPPVTRIVFPVNCASLFSLSKTIGSLSNRSSIWRVLTFSAIGLSLFSQLETSGELNT